MIYKPFGKEAKVHIETLQNLYDKSSSQAQKKLILNDLTKLKNGYCSVFHLGSTN